MSEKEHDVREVVVELLKERKMKDCADCQCKKEDSAEFLENGSIVFQVLKRI